MTTETIDITTIDGTHKLLLFMAVNAHNLVQDGMYYPHQMEKVEKLLELCRQITETLDNGTGD